MKTFKFEVGDTVFYHPIIGRESDGKEYTILDRWILGHGESVYKLEGKAGCVSERAILKKKAP